MVGGLGGGSALPLDLRPLRLQLSVRKEPLTETRSPPCARMYHCSESGVLLLRDLPDFRTPLCLAGDLNSVVWGACGNGQSNGSVRCHSG